MSVEKLKSEIEEFMKSDDDNKFAFELKKLTNDTIDICIADTLNFTIKIKDLEKGLFYIETKEELLDDWKRTVNAYCKQGNRNIYDVLIKCTDAYNQLDGDDGDEEEGEDEEIEIEDGDGDGDVFEPIVVDKTKRSDYDPMMEEVSKRFGKISQQNQNIKGAVDRLMKDYLYVLKSDTKKYGYTAEPIGDDLFHWEVKLFGFDKKDCKDFVNDLEAYAKKSKTGQNYVLLDMKFPPEYPFKPPFIRVVRPRFAFRTGHVTIGGSICMELLTTSGWRPINTLEAVFIMIRAEMSSGGARLDLNNLSDYTEREAQEAFYRVAKHHGWQ